MQWLPHMSGHSTYYLYLLHLNKAGFSGAQRVDVHVLDSLFAGPGGASSGCRAAVKGHV